MAYGDPERFGALMDLLVRSVSQHLIAQIEAGQVFVNDWISGTVEHPFGGYKQSGYGKEKGIEALHHYTQLKSITVRL